MSGGWNRGRQAHARALVAALTAAVCLAGSSGQTPAQAHKIDLVTDVDGPTRAWVLDRLERFRHALDALVLEVTGIPPKSDSLKVLLYQDRVRYTEHVQAQAPRLVHNGGYYDGATGTVVSYLRANPLRLQFHEMVHAVLGDVFGDPAFYRYGRPHWPVWFDEGFAEVAASWRPHGAGMRLAQPNHARMALWADAHASQRQIAIHDLLLTSPQAFSGPSADLYYAHAWALVDLLVADPALSQRLPAWIGLLNAGQDGYVSFLETFGPDLTYLERRLQARQAELHRPQAASNTLFEGDTLDLWTLHGGGHWVTDASTPGGASGRLDPDNPDGWAFLTRDVLPTDVMEWRMEVRRTAGALGLALGHHRVAAYPYHTLIDLDLDRVTVRHSANAHDLKVVSRKRAKIPANDWVQVRVVLAGGLASVFVGNQHVLSATAGHHTVSLLGFYLRGGGAAVRHTQMGVGTYAAGPAEAVPPTFGGPAD